MPIFVSRLMRRITRLKWTFPLGLILFVFGTSWPLMLLAEPAGSTLVKPENYWWWFLITAATVGYGDFFPVSLGGHLVGIYVVIGGIATLTALFARLAAIIENAKGRRMHGTVSLSHSGHIVVLGYTPGRTERIIEELLADGGRPVVLCAWDEAGTHPMPEHHIDFVRGDLTDDRVLRRACVHQARSVLIDARDDNEALAMLVTVDHIAKQAHIVVALRDLEKAAHLSYVNSDVRCVQWHHPRMLTEELQDPGITQVYAELMTHGGESTYSVVLPDSLGRVTFGDCQTVLGQRHEATVLAVGSGDKMFVSPPWSKELQPGMVLYYVGRERLSSEEVARQLKAKAR